jgi:plasmid stabilization system protein ParE
MKPVTVHPEAEAEADQAFSRYYAEIPSIAFGFDDELIDAYKRLRAAPLTGVPYLRNTRRMILHRYPFSVVFRERLHDIQIVAIAHAKRRPGYWIERLKQ